MAGTTAAEHIRKNDAAGEITILTNENLPFYYRTRLNDYIAGKVSADGLIAKKVSWYKKQRIILYTSTKAASVDPKKKMVLTEDHRSFDYDRLLIATGSLSFVPPIQGADKSGVFALRDVQDARAIKSYSQNRVNVMVIGGGLLGLESGNAFIQLGKKVTIAEFFPRLLPRQLDNEGAQRLQQIMEKMGFSFKLAARITEITGADRATGIRLEDGETIPAEMVIISAGVRANLDLAKSIDLEYDKGIKVDETMQTSTSNIYAAGDVAEFKGLPPSGLWPASMQQGKVAGTVMAGGRLRYVGTPVSSQLKVAGIQLGSMGEIDVEGKFASRVWTNEDEYTKIVIKDNRIIGCIMLGNTKDFLRITRAISENADISLIEDLLPA